MMPTHDLLFVWLAVIVVAAAVVGVGLYIIGSKP